MDATDKDSPNYLKPAAGFGQMQFPTCQHDYRPREGNAALFDCGTCKAVRPAHMLEQKAGKWVMKRITVQPWKPRRR